MKPAIGNKVAIIIAFFLLVSIKIVLLNSVLSSETIGPQALNDELIYRLNSERIFNKTPYYSGHYPPFYPLLLSFAFFSKNNWYQWMFYINAVLSSLVLIPVWFISLRFLSRAASLAVLLISSLSTLHFFYPGLILSENLHVPIFAFSLYLLLDADKGTRSKKMIVSVLFGITMALGYMTKFIYLVAIPVLIFLWCIKPLFNDDPEERRVIGSSRLFDLLSMGAGFVLTYLPWFLYKYYSGFGIGGGMGVEFVRSGIREFADLGSFFLWSGFYLSYSILALAPFLLVFVLYIFMLSSNSVKNDRQETFFILAVIFLSAIFFMTAVQHSWRAGYNYPLPKRINGRYLMQLMPIWVIIFMIALTKLKNAAARFPVSRVVYSTLLCLVLLFFSLALLRSDFAPWSYDFTNTTDGLFYRSGPSFVLLATWEGLVYRSISSSVLFGIIFSVMVIMLLLCCRSRFTGKYFVFLFSALAVAIQADSAFTPYRYMLYHRTDYQLHGRALSPFISQEVKQNHEKIVIVSDQAELLGKSGGRLQESIQFWVSTSMSKPSIKFISFNDFLSHDGNWDGKLYGITTDLTGNPIYNYIVNGKKYYIYDIDTWPGKITGGFHQEDHLKPTRRD